MQLINADPPYCKFFKTIYLIVLDKYGFTSMESFAIWPHWNEVKWRDKQID